MKAKSIRPPSDRWEQAEQRLMDQFFLQSSKKGHASSNQMGVGQVSSSNESPSSKDSNTTMVVGPRLPTKQENLQNFPELDTILFGECNASVVAPAEGAYIPRSTFFKAFCMKNGDRISRTAIETAFLEPYDGRPLTDSASNLVASILNDINAKPNLTNKLYPNASSNQSLSFYRKHTEFKDDIANKISVSKNRIYFDPKSNNFGSATADYKANVHLLSGEHEYVRKIYEGALVDQHISKRTLNAKYSKSPHRLLSISASNIKRKSASISNLEKESAKIATKSPNSITQPSTATTSPLSKSNSLQFYFDPTFPIEYLMDRSKAIGNVVRKLETLKSLTAFIIRVDRELEPCTVIKYHENRFQVKSLVESDSIDEWLDENDIIFEEEAAASRQDDKMSLFACSHARAISCDLERSIIVKQLTKLMNDSMKDTWPSFSTFWTGQLVKDVDNKVISEIENYYYEALTAMSIISSKNFVKYSEGLPLLDYTHYTNEVGMYISRNNTQLEGVSVRQVVEQIGQTIIVFRNAIFVDVVYRMRGALFFEIRGEGKLEHAFGKAILSPDAFLQKNSVLSRNFRDSITLRCPKIVSDAICELEFKGTRGASCVLSTLAKEYIIPEISKLVSNGIIRLFRDNQLHVSLQLLLCCKEGLHSIGLKESLLDNAKQLVDSLKLWIISGLCKFGICTLQIQPENHRVIATIMEELVNESREYVEILISDLNNEVVPWLEDIKGLTFNLADMQVEEVIANSDECARLFQILSTYSKVRLESRLKKGIFSVLTCQLQLDIDQFIKGKKLSIKSIITDMMKREMAELLNTQNIFLALPESVTFEQTRQATIELNQMRKRLPYVQSQSVKIVHLKQYLDTLKWNLTDTLFVSYYQCYQVQFKIKEFLDQRYENVSGQMVKLRLTIGKEIVAFLELWTSVNNVLEKIFPRPKDGALKTDKDMASAKPISKKSRLIPLVEEAHLKILQENLKNALQIASTIQKKVDCINEFQDVPRSQELREVYDYMITCQTTITGVIDIQRNLKIWRSQALIKLDFNTIYSNAIQFLAMANKSKMIESSKVLHSAWMETEQYLENEFIITKVLLYPSFKVWHWERIRDILGFAFDIQTHTILSVLENNNWPSTIEQLVEIQSQAIRGSYLEETIETIQNRLYSLECQLDSYGGHSGLVVFEHIWRLIDIIDSDLLTLGMVELSGDHYNNAVNSLVGKLTLAQQTLRELELMQPLMIKCFCFFESTDVKSQLYAQHKRFNALDRVYQVLISKVHESGNLGALIDLMPEVVSVLISLKDGLTKLVQDIQFWLDNLRFAFPRLYFISDDELLDLLSVGENLNSIKKFLPKVFEFSGFEFNSHEKIVKILGLKGTHYEIMMLGNPICTNEGVEKWLSKVELEMKSSMKQLLLKVLGEYKFREEYNPIDFYKKYGLKVIGQILIVASQIFHSKELRKLTVLGQYQSIKRLHQRSMDVVRQLVTMGPLAFSNVAAYHSCISLEIYYREWAFNLSRSKVSNLIDSDVWLNGIKIDYDDNELEVSVSQSIYRLDYGYEYLGGSTRLIWNDLLVHSFRAIWSAYLLMEAMRLGKLQP